jgi:transcriptional regulator with XRE-family HTH domain
METKILGSVIKQIREEKQISQEVLSGLANMNRSYLSKIELGLRNPTISVLYKIADALNVNASDILRDVESIRN